MQNKFFGSKLNSVLLLILIVLMIIAIIIMRKNEEIYLKGFQKIDQNIDNNQNQNQNEITGNKEDLISFSVAPGQKVSGTIKVTGEIKGGYFFEANILVNVLDNNKSILKKGYGTATTDWMTSGPVAFTALIDFTELNSGPGYVEIQNDDPSDGEGGPAKKILIPITIN